MYIKNLLHIYKYVSIKIYKLSFFMTTFMHTNYYWFVYTYIKKIDYINEGKQTDKIICENLILSLIYFI